MTRHMDTYWCVIGAMPLVNPWWLLSSDNTPDDFTTTNAREWVGWSVTIQEYDPDEEQGIPGEYVIDHHNIMRTLEKIMADAYTYAPTFIDNVRNLLAGDIDSVDFDSDTADVLLQMICFDEIRYG